MLNSRHQHQTIQQPLLAQYPILYCITTAAAFTTLHVRPTVFHFKDEWIYHQPSTINHHPSIIPDNSTYPPTHLPTHPSLLTPTLRLTNPLLRLVFSSSSIFFLARDIDQPPIPFWLYLCAPPNSPSYLHFAAFWKPFCKSSRLLCFAHQATCIQQPN